MAVALSTSGHEAARSIPDEAWVDGGTPEQSHVLPWAVHSPRRADVSHRQGHLAASFVRGVVTQLVGYIDPDT